MRKRPSIRFKIILAFTLVLICTIGLGLFSIDRLKAVDVAAAEIRDNRLPSTRILGELSYLTMRFRELEATHALADTAEGKAGEVKRLEEARLAIETTFGRYAPLVLPGEERTLADAMASRWAAYLDMHRTFLIISNSGNHAAIMAVFRFQMQQAFTAFTEALQADIAFNVAEGKRAAALGAQLGASARLWIGTAMGVATALALLIGWSLVRGISMPIRMMTAAMSRLAQHDLTVGVPGVGRADEIGAMADAVQVFKDNAIHARELEQEQEEAQARRIKEDERVSAEAERAAAAEAASLVVGSIGAGLERMAAGDLTFRVDTQLPASYEKLRQDLNGASAQLQSAMQAISGITRGIRAGTGEIAQAADDLSRRTEQQAASLEETAAALEEITTSVKRTADGTKQAREVVLQTRASAERSGKVVDQAVAAMSEIEASSRQIGQIIGVIDEIAFQTNLLALNAGVEAARAGDAGRGFAVVASEVRALAQRSAEAAKEIKGLISASGQQVGAGVKLVGETGQALAQIAAQVAEVSGVIEEIAHASQEQATGLVEVNAAVNQMDQVTQQNAAMVEQSAAATQGLVEETAELARLTGGFRLGEGAVGKAEPAAAPPRPAPPAAARSSRPLKRGAPQLKVVAAADGAVSKAGRAADKEWEEF